MPPTPLPVTFRRNLHSLSLSQLSSVVSSSLPSPTHFSSLDVNAATDTLIEQLVVSFHLYTHMTPTNHTHCSNSHLLLLSPHWGRSIQTSPLQPSYNMSSRPNPLAPSSSNLSHTLTSTHTHYQHISPHRHLPHCVQLERGVFNQVSLFLSQNNKLDAKQSGFRSGH